MKVTIVGCGEAFDSERGNNSALLWGNSTPVCLIDCGYQVPERLWKMPELYPSIELIYFTHFHADHSFGIVPLLGRYWEEGRREELFILGPPGVREHVHGLMERGYPGMMKRLAFAVRFVEMDPARPLRHGTLLFRCAPSNHSVRNLSVRIDGPEDRSIGMSGDGALTQAMRNLFSDVNVLLQETYLLQGGFFAHANLESLQEYVNGPGFRIGRIGVTHVSRHHREEMKQSIERLSREDIRWFLAEPGMEIEIENESTAQVAS